MAAERSRSTMTVRAKIPADLLEAGTADSAIGAAPEWANMRTSSNARVW